jgi:hypothetical protein
MDKIIYIGGVGSHNRQVDVISRELSDYYKKDVIGLTLRAARQDPVRVARLVQDNLVVTHSAGMTVLGDTAPSEVIAIAPPLPALAYELILRSLSKTVELYKSRRESYERQQKIRLYHSGSVLEHITQPQHNVGHLPRIVQFDAAHQAVAFVTRGTKVTLGFMDNDMLYPRSGEHHNVITAEQHGVVVHNNLLGHHDEFVLYPLDVLAQLNQR